MKHIARRTAACGERVHPLRERGKAPLLKGWQRAATTNTKQVDKWWQRWPDANVGIVIPNGSIQVDVDDARAHDGFRERVPDQETYLVRTPRGGWHYLYRGSVQSCVLIGDQKGGRPLELRGPGKNRVAPGSVTADGTWALVADIPPAPLPTELIAWVNETTVSKPSNSVRVGRGDLAGRTIWKGQRNMLMFKQAAFLRRTGGRPRASRRSCRCTTASTASRHWTNPRSSGSLPAPPATRSAASGRWTRGGTPST